MKIFRANDYHKSIYTIDFHRLYRMGIRGILFDIDNTLVPHGKESTSKVEKFLSNLKDIGFKIALMSNNSKERIELFNKNLKLPYIAKAKKPSKYGYERLRNELKLKKTDIVFVGDQLFTDILGANLYGIKSILVQPIDKDEPFKIVFKRKFEKIFLCRKCFI